MAYSELLADRVRVVLQNQGGLHVQEKRMMGGLTFMVNGKMCVGIIGDELMARIGPGVYEKALQKPGCRQMDFTGKPMVGYVYVEPQAIDMDEELSYWVGLALKFNPEAKASGK